MGRPSKYKPEFCEQARKLCALGAKDTEIADFFKVSEATLNNWKNDYPEFLESLKEGKRIFDNETVVNSLLHRAIGYTAKETKVFMNNGEPVTVEVDKHYPPDVTACIFWLKNRLPDEWRDKVEQSVSQEGENKYTIQIVKPDESN